ncbi:MAG TPA: hypothetical protein VKW04_24385 [Planctomycetota bacterium]|nr:hypothetical protein [Planctomycetota bacterium]
MKGKGGSLYEVLKSASRAPGVDPGAPSAPDTTPVSDGNQGTLQERLAAYKAAKLAAASQGTSDLKPDAAVPTPKVTATTLVLEPDPTPVPAPTVVRVERPAPAAPVSPVPDEEESSPDPSPARGLGERVIALSYNTVLFGGMVLVGLLFISYAVGLHVGKNSSLVEASVTPTHPVLPAPLSPPPAVKPTPAPVAPPPLKKEYTIRLCEMKTTTSQERLKALAFAEDSDLKKALERAGHKGFEKAFITRGGEVRMALYVDRFSDNNAEGAKAALTAMKNFRFKSQTPFAQAVFEEVAPR